MDDLPVPGEVVAHRVGTEMHISVANTKRMRGLCDGPWVRTLGLQVARACEHKLERCAPDFRGKRIVLFATSLPGRKKAARKQVRDANRRVTGFLRRQNTRRRRRIAENERARRPRALRRPILVAVTPALRRG